jgi:hypothetical protein
LLDVVPGKENDKLEGMYEAAIAARARRVAEFRGEESQMTDWQIVAVFFAACVALNWLGPKLDAKLWARRWLN